MSRKRVHYILLASKKVPLALSLLSVRPAASSFYSDLQDFVGGKFIILVRVMLDCTAV